MSFIIERKRKSGCTMPLPTTEYSSSIIICDGRMLENEKKSYRRGRGVYSRDYFHDIQIL